MARRYQPHQSREETAHHSATNSCPQEELDRLRDTAFADVFADEVEGSCHLPCVNLLASMDPLLLSRPYKDYSSLWEWILHQKRAYVVASSLLNEEMFSDKAIVPVSAVNRKTGDTVLTTSKHGVLKAKVVLLLIETGERLDHINPITGDSFLHAIAKLRRRTTSETQRTEALRSVTKIINILNEPLSSDNINFPDPDFKNIDGMTALHLSLEADDIALAKLLVSKLGANHSIKPSGRFTTVHELGGDKTALIMSWDNNYGLRSNTSEIGEEGDVCAVCCDPLDTPDELYMLECCGQILHINCLRTSLARGSTPRCMLCNMLHTEEIRCKVPNTIYKMKWAPITKEDIEASAEARRRTAAAKLAASLAKSKKEDEAVRREYEEVKYSSIDEVVWVTSDEEEEQEVEEEATQRETAEVIYISDEEEEKPQQQQQQQHGMAMGQLEEEESERSGTEEVMDRRSHYDIDDDDDDFVPRTIAFRLPLYLQRAAANGRRSGVASTANGRRRSAPITRRRNRNNNHTEWRQEVSRAGPIRSTPRTSTASPVTEASEFIVRATIRHVLRII